MTGKAGIWFSLVLGGTLTISCGQPEPAEINPAPTVQPPSDRGSSQAYTPSPDKTAQLEKKQGSVAGSVNSVRPFNVCMVSVDRGTCEGEDPKSLRLEAELCYRDGSKKRLKSRSCSALYEKIRALHPGRTVRSDNHAIDIRPGLILYNNMTVLEHARGQCKEIFCATDFVRNATKLLSFVGPYLTFADATSDAGGGGPPYHSTDWISYDLDKNAPADILDAFEMDSLLDALRADKWVAENFLPQDMSSLKAAKTFDQVRKLLGKYGFHRMGMERFAVYDYDAKKERAAVRLGFKLPEAGLDLNKVNTLGLWVKPKKAMRRSLENATKGRGFFMSTKKVDRLVN